MKDILHSQLIGLCILTQIWQVRENIEIFMEQLVRA